jgi:alpha-L-arabinofuranosidase
MLTHLAGSCDRGSRGSRNGQGFCSLFLVAVVLGLVNTASGQIQYTVGDAVSSPVNRLVMGGNLNIGAMQYLAQGGLTPDSRVAWSDGALAQLESAIGGLHRNSSLRFPGGTYMAAFQWQDAIGPVDSRPATQWEVRSSGNTQYRAAWGVDEMLQLCGRYNIMPVFTLDVVNNNAESQLFDSRRCSNIAWISYVNGDSSSTQVIGVDAYGQDWGTVGDWATLREQNLNAGPFGAVYWEIGNESFAYDPLGRSMSSSDYADSFQAMATSIRDYFPDVQLLANTSMTDRTQPDPWNVQQLVQGLAGHMDGLQTHPYSPWRYPEDRLERYRDTVVNAEVQDEIISHWSQVLDNNNNPGLPLAFTEWGDPKGWALNPDNNWYRDGKRLQAGIHHAVTLMTYLKRGDRLALANYWNTFSFNPNSMLQANVYSKLPDGTPVFHEMYVENAMAHTQKLFTDHFGEYILEDWTENGDTFEFEAVAPVGQDTFDDVLTIASRDEDGQVLYVIVVNRDNAETHEIDFDLLGFGDGTEFLVESWQVGCIVAIPGDHVAGTEDDFVAYNKLTNTPSGPGFSLEVGTTYADHGLLPNGFRMIVGPSTVTAYEIRVVPEPGIASILAAGILLFRRRSVHRCLSGSGGQGGVGRARN